MHHFPIFFFIRLYTFSTLYESKRNCMKKAASNQLQSIYNCLSRIIFYCRARGKSNYNCCFIKAFIHIEKSRYEENIKHKVIRQNFFDIPRPEKVLAFCGPVSLFSLHIKSEQSADLASLMRALFTKHTLTKPLAKTTRQTLSKSYF